MIYTLRIWLRRFKNYWLITWRLIWLCTVFNTTGYLTISSSAHDCLPSSPSKALSAVTSLKLLFVDDWLTTSPGPSFIEPIHLSNWPLIPEKKMQIKEHKNVTYAASSESSEWPSRGLAYVQFKGQISCWISCRSLGATEISKEYNLLNDLVECNKKNIYFKIYNQPLKTTMINSVNPRLGRCWRISLM